MRRAFLLVRFTAVAVAPYLAIAQTTSTAPLDGGRDQSVAITGVTVIDVLTGQRRSGVTVVTRGERIAAIGPEAKIPGGATRVNGRGKFLLPGLWDMHTHHQGTGAECLDLFIAKGVTGTRDMGGDADFILPLREPVRSVAVLGPEVVASGPILDDAPPSFPFIAGESRACDSSVLPQHGPINIRKRWRTRQHHRQLELVAEDLDNTRHTFRACQSKSP